MEDKKEMTPEQKVDLRIAQAEKFKEMALVEFEHYVDWLELAYEEWECVVIPQGEPNFEMRWSTKIVVKVDKDTFKIGCAGRYGFTENVKAVDLRQMFAIVCGISMHPRGEMFNWILMQEHQFRLGDPTHDSITEVLLRGIISGLFLAGVGRNEIVSAYMEQSHFEYNTVRVLNTIKGKDNRHRHDSKK